MYKLFSWVRISLFFIFKKIIFISPKTCIKDIHEFTISIRFTYKYNIKIDN